MRVLTGIWLFCMIGFTSCNSFLDVKPKDQYLSEYVFSDSAVIELAREGFLSQLASHPLYGGTLTMGALDVMAQYYRYPAGHVMHAVGHYDYGNVGVDTIFAETWRAAYQFLLNLNSYIAGVKASNDVLDEGYKQLLLGEAYGLRAYIHFDLLRLFGPIYTDHANGMAIPYLLSASASVSPILPVHDVLSRLLLDIDVARDHFAASKLLPHAIDRFSNTALEALVARIHCYVGNPDQARKAAAKVVEMEGKHFPWATDQLLASEVIYGVPIRVMGQQYNRYFYPNLPPQFLLTPIEGMLGKVYGNNIMDVRYRANWIYYPKADRRIDAFQKYGPSASFVPLIRISELYFILAEYASDENAAMEYLALVAQQRRELLETAIPFEVSLTDAYRREFWGEGQLFYYYKRKFLPLIPDGNQVFGTQEMNSKKYQIPLPRTEMIYR